MNKKIKLLLIIVSYVGVAAVSIGIAKLSGIFSENKSTPVDNIVTASEQEPASPEESATASDKKLTTAEEVITAYLNNPVDNRELLVK